MGGRYRSNRLSNGLCSRGEADIISVYETEGASSILAGNTMFYTIEDELPEIVDTDSHPLVFGLTKLVFTSKETGPVDLPEVPVGTIMLFMGPYGPPSDWKIHSSIDGWFDLCWIIKIK